MIELVTPNIPYDQLRVVVVSDIDSHNPYGSYQRVFSIADALSKHCNVSLIGTECNSSVNMDTYSIGTHSLIKYTNRLAVLLRKINPDIVYAHRNLPGFSVSILRSLSILPKEVRVVFDFHSSAVFEYLHLSRVSLSKWSSTYKIKKNEVVEKFILSQKCNLITVSPRLKLFLREHYHSDTPMHVVPNGAPDKYFNYSKVPRNPYSKMGECSIALLIAPRGFISNNLAVEMAREVAEVLSAAKSNVRIVVIGGGWDNEADYNFEVIGFVDNIIDYIDYADICLLPYPSVAVCGGVRTKAVEYLARKKILISTKEGISGFSELTHMESVIISSDNASEFANTLMMVSNDLEKYKNIGENGFRIAEKKYNYSEIARTIIGILQEKIEQ